MIISAVLGKWLHAIGSALGMAGMVFVGFRMHSYWGGLDKSHLNVATLIASMPLAFTYAVNNIFLALSWKNLLAHLRAPLNWQSSTKIYGVSQLAKYLPGNIFHLAGRQALGMSAGISPSALAKSTVWELGLIAFAGALFSALVLPVFWQGLPPTAALLLWAAIVAIAAIGLNKVWGRHIKAAFLLQVLFLAVSGLIFVFLLECLSGQSARPALWVLAGGAYVVAWLSGLVTPGAPAGVGVREMVLILLLDQAIPETELLPAVLVSRMVTVAGDLIFFLVSCRTRGISAELLSGGLNR
jgi:hypothetical protein